MNNLIKAMAILKDSEYTCVLCNEEDVITSTKRGVAPLLGFLDENKDYSNYSAADKVIGNGAAFLYVLLGIKKIYADVISQSALDTLKKHDINITYNVLTEAIRNRDNTGFCPIESAVSGISSPEDALIAIRNRLASMNK